MLLVRRAGDWPTPGWSDPFQELERIRRRMDAVSSAFMRGPFGERAAGVFPMMNVTEDKDKYYVRAELPGMKADDLAIDVTANTFSVSGERRLAAESEKARYHRREREAGTFSRILTLPAEINAEKVEARCADGVLTVILPKAEAAKPRRIAVKS